MLMSIFFLVQMHETSFLSDRFRYTTECSGYFPNDTPVRTYTCSPHPSICYIALGRSIHAYMDLTARAESNLCAPIRN